LGVSKETVVDRLSECDIDLRNGVENPEHLDHIVRSGWEVHIANLLNENDIEYEYEGIEITWVDESGNEHTYTPDFVTENFVIEVKGRVWKEGNESTKARAAMDTIDNKQYIVIGNELPCDIHIEWGNEAALLEKF
jgi:hypothetical protein